MSAGVGMDVQVWEGRELHAEGMAYLKILTRQDALQPPPGVAKLGYVGRDI